MTLRKNFIIYLSLILILFSCNVLEVVDRKQQKKFTKEDFTVHNFTSDSSTHHVRFRDTGKPRLMLLHGYGASGVGQYYRAALDLSDQYDIILPDLLHNGRSKSVSGDFSIDAQVEHVRLILDSLKITEPIAVIGNSYGGIVASYFADRYPERIAKLGIYDSPVLHYTGQYADSIAKAMGVGDIRNLLSPRTVFENKKSLDVVFHDQPFIPRFLRRQMVKYGSLPVRDRQIKLLEFLLENEVAMNNYKFVWKMPVYILWGRHDQLIPISTAERIIRDYNIPESRVFIFENAAHAVNVEHPDEFVDAVRKIMEN